MSLPISSRKELRQLLKPYEEKSNQLAVTLVAMDYGLFLIGLFLVIALPLWSKFLGSLVLCIAIVRLFVLGHDACHGSFTSSRRLNYWLGQLAFLPSMTTFRGWMKSHNLVHHGLTNLVTTKDVWRPLSISDYQNLSNNQKLLYRIYRSSFGVFLYYLFEVWAKYLFFPFISHHEYKSEKKFIYEFLMITVFLMLWLFLLHHAAVITQQNSGSLFLFGYFIPFILWNMAMSFLIYLHHTHPKIAWYADHDKWIHSMPHITATVHLRFPSWISAGIHHIMEHPAHHLSMNIPCYNLREAQRKLEEVLPKHIVIQDFSWRWFLECTKICKLYDFENKKWLLF